MSEVNIEINDRKYRMACEDGQESRLVSLGERLNGFVDGFKGEFGEIGDNRLVVMAGIAAVDALSEAEEKIEKLRQDLELITSQGERLGGAHLELEKNFAKSISDVARKIEVVADSLEKSTKSRT